MYTDLSLKDRRDLDAALADIRLGSDNGDSSAYAENIRRYVGAVRKFHEILGNCRPYEGIGGSGLLREFFVLSRDVNRTVDTRLGHLLDFANLIDRHPEIFDRYSEKELVAKFGAALNDLSVFLSKSEKQEVRDGSGI